MNSETISLRGMQIPICSIQENLLVLGTTGSGKTTFLLSMLSELLTRNTSDEHRKRAAVVFDVKGDLLKPISSVLESCGRAQDLIVIGEGNPVAFNPLAGLSPTQITNLLIAVSGIAGQEISQRAKLDDMFWATSRQEVLTAICELAAMTARAVGKYPLSLMHVQRLSRMLHQSLPQLVAWVADVKSLLSESAATALEGMATLPDSTRSCIATSVSGVLGPYARSPIRELVNPSADRPEVDLAEALFQQGKVIVITVGQMENAAELMPAMILFKAALFNLVLARRRTHLNQERHLWIAMDEFARTFLPHESVGAAAEHVTLEMSRASGVGFLLAAQNLCGLEAIAGGETLVQKLAALCRNIAFFQNSCPVTARMAQAVFGNRRVVDEHRTRVPKPPAPLLIPHDEDFDSEEGNVVLVPSYEPVVSPDRLARLRTGEAVIKLSDGSTHTIRPETLA